VNRVVDELLEKGHIARPYLGLAMQAVTLPEALQKKTAATSALLVVHVEASGPADKAGVLLGDLLVDLQGKAVSDTDDVQAMLASVKVGDAVQATFLRGGSAMKTAVTLADRAAR